MLNAEKNRRLSKKLASALFFSLVSYLFWPCNILIQKEMRKSSDGNIWQIVKNKNGVKRWQLVPPFAAQKSHSKKHHLLFCEPYTTNLRQRQIHTGPRIIVGDALYQAILRAPKKYTSDNSNAYVFGKKYPLSTYRLLGEHGNDGAQTGFIDLDVAKKVNWPDDIGEEVLKFYRDKTRHMKKWDDRAALRQMRTKLPFIVFLGETFGGDVGASLYGHYHNRTLDSLIIDVWHFYKN
jgi:hypothetical protein